MEAEEYPYLVVSLLSDDGTKIGFNTPTQAVSFTIISRFNLIDILFHGLDILYKESPYKITVSDLLGSLLSSERSHLQLTCSMLPPHFLQPLCVYTQHLNSLRLFLYFCTCICDGVECFESDSAGNHSPLVIGINQNDNDHTLVKDVTDAFQTKLLDLRICQESDQDPTDIVESIHLIWKNVLLLWNLEDSPGFDQLNDRWKDILSWERSTRKKQVKNDAKLVLATRLCLEQGKIRKKPNFANQKRSPLECLGHFEPIHVWTVLVLAEYFRSLLISHAISCYIHQLLCPHECNMASPSKLGTNLILPEQLYISEMIKTKKESIALAKRLLTHCHKYQISKIIPNQYIPESEESSSELSNESDSDSDILESQLQIGNNSSFTTPLSRNTMSNHSTKLSNNESRISNTSLSVSDVRLPPQPIPPDDYPFHVNQVHPTPSEFEPKSRNSNEQNRQRSRSLDLTSGRKRVPPPPFGSPDDSLKRVSPSTSSSTPKSDSRIFSRAEYRTPIVAFGRSSSTSPLHSKSRSTPENYLLSSSSLRSLEGTSPRTSFDPSDARKRSKERIREKMRHDSELKLRMKQEAAMRRDKLKSLELKAQIARLSHQPTQHLPIFDRVTDTPTTPSGELAKTPPSRSRTPPNPSSNSAKIKRSPKVKTDPGPNQINEDSAVSPEEARYRALVRLKEHREKIKREKELQERARFEQIQQKWEIRDKKIRDFIARQESKSPSNHFSSPPNTPSKLIINWDAANDQIVSSTQPRNHLEETLEEIQEMSALIDNALGIQTSHSPNHMLQQHVRSTATQDISPASPYSPTKLTDMLCIKVIQLHSLPNGMPKNLQLYLSFNWDGLGRASTHALRPPKHVYNATLRFRSPLPHGSSLQDALMNSPPLVIELLSRNENGHPDLCLGRKFIEDPSLFDLRKQPLQIKLDDGNNGMVGIVEIEIVIM